MKTRLMIVGSALMASLFCLPARAQTGPGTGPYSIPGRPAAARRDAAPYRCDPCSD